MLVVTRGSGELMKRRDDCETVRRNMRAKPIGIVRSLPRLK